MLKCAAVYGMAESERMTYELTGPVTGSVSLIVSEADAEEADQRRIRGVSTRKSKGRRAGRGRNGEENQGMSTMSDRPPRRQEGPSPGTRQGS